MTVTQELSLKASRKWQIWRRWRVQTNKTMLSELIAVASDSEISQIPLADMMMKIIVLGLPKTVVIMRTDASRKILHGRKILWKYQTQITITRIQIKTCFYVNILDQLFPKLKTTNIQNMVRVISYFFRMKRKTNVVINLSERKVINWKRLLKQKKIRGIRKRAKIISIKLNSSHTLLTTL